MQSLLPAGVLNYQNAGFNATPADTAQLHPMASMSHGQPFFTASSEQYSNGLSNSGNGFSQNAFSHVGDAGLPAVANDGAPAFSMDHDRLDIERRSRAFVLEGVPLTLSHLTLASFFSVSLLGS